MPFLLKTGFNLLYYIIFFFFLQELCNIFPPKIKKRRFESNICPKKGKKYLEIYKKKDYTCVANRNIYQDVFGKDEKLI